MPKPTNPAQDYANLDIYYLSFADDDGFKGVCVVEASDGIEAVKKAHRLGINPGGQVMITLIPREVHDKAPKRLPFNRLMDKATLIELGGPVKSLREMKE